LGAQTGPMKPTAANTIPYHPTRLPFDLTLTNYHA
jgi:hypothetical protein